MKKKYAYLLMGPNYDPRHHRAEIETEQRIGLIRTVRDFAEACAVADALIEEGVEIIELCGAFGEAGARDLIAHTGGRVGIGYVVHLPEQDGLFSAFFAPPK